MYPVTGNWRGIKLAALVLLLSSHVTIGLGQEKAPETLPTPQTPELVAPSKLILPEDRPIGKISATITPKGELLPKNIAAQRYEDEQELVGDVPRPWEQTLYFWDAPDFCHRALLFEDVCLERHGYSHCRILQPGMSAVFFVTAAAAAPYNAVARPDCIYPLGHYRAGSRVPFRHMHPELRASPSIVQSAIVLGLVFALP